MPAVTREMSHKTGKNKLRGSAFKTVPSSVQGSRICPVFGLLVREEIETEES